MSKALRYVLITPARNEAQFIELAIKSVAAQKTRPIKWVIVSDGSTDGTDEIVGKYSAEYPWIELVRMPEHSERNFAGKVHAFNAGYSRMKNLQYDAIASMDADISFDSEYFSFLLDKFAEDSRLGLVGTPFQNASNQTYDYRFTSIEHVSGACQLFRRSCFEQIGGYIPVKAGGVDLAAVMAARMKGWKTRTFTEKVCMHHREMGTALGGGLAASFSQGVKDYAFGGHPVWELFRFAYQTTRRPILLGGLALGAGYFWAAIHRSERPIPREMVAFRRHEQMQRLKNALFRARTKLIPS
jgi:glycosyltransferase involved in cell wall biosynthesis